ncbi:MAG: hypothetical protein J7K59_01605 [Candidatus Korarchaeota archaeon]|nr:hypothetical protein [Candidatus Korarchaeota archaeon]
MIYDHFLVRLIVPDDIDITKHGKLLKIGQISSVEILSELYLILNG